jgi:hypothetical protein
MAASRIARDIQAWARVNDLRRLAERTARDHGADCTCPLCAPYKPPLSEKNKRQRERRQRLGIPARTAAQNLRRKELRRNRKKELRPEIGYSTKIGQDGWPIDPRHPANANDKPRWYTS